MTNGVLDFEAMFDSWAKSTEKKWSHDRSQSVGASEVFGCIRKAWFSKRGAEFGFEKDPDFVQGWGATKRGDLIENYLVVPAVTHGLAEQQPDAELLFAGGDQDTIVSGRASATPDGLIVGAKRRALRKYGIEDIGSNCFVLEIKSIDPRVGLAEEKAIHRGQVQMQMGLIRDTTDYRPNYAVIVYINASFHDNISVFVVEYDEKVYIAGKRRAENVWSIDNPAKLAPEGKFENGCEYCPFQTACSTVTVGMVPTDTPKPKKGEVDRDEEIEELAAAYKEKAAAKKKAEHDYEVVVNAMKEALADRGKNRFSGEDFKVSWYTVKGRKTLDREAMQEAGIDLSAFEKDGNPYDVLRISLVD